jgi:hypothetical protein
MRTYSNTHLYTGRTHNVLRCFHITVNKTSIQKYGVTIKCGPCDASIAAARCCCVLCCDAGMSGQFRRRARRRLGPLWGSEVRRFQRRVGGHCKNVWRSEVLNKCVRMFFCYVTTGSPSPPPGHHSYFCIGVQVPRLASNPRPRARGAGTMHVSDNTCVVVEKSAINLMLRLAEWCCMTHPSRKNCK